MRGVVSHNESERHRHDRSFERTLEMDFHGIGATFERLEELWSVVDFDVQLLASQFQN